MAKPVMVCIGKAGQDIFLQGDVFKPLKENGLFYEHIKLGEKFYVDDATLSTGGNAANAAVTFARQHLPVRFVGALGADSTGHSILQILDDEHVDTSLVDVNPQVRTSFSTILLAPTGERTILDYPGTAKLTDNQLELNDIKADWLYISSVGSMSILKKIMKHAHQQGVNIAFNPASFELKHLQDCADLLQFVTLFAVNKEEAAHFVKGDTIKQMIRALAESVKYVLISDGPKGAVATDGHTLVSAGMYEDVPVLDRTGAGDAFTSGFVAKIAQGSSVEEAVVFASANSTSVVGKIGAKEGILRAGVKLHDMPTKIETL